MVTDNQQEILDWLEEVKDPEVPVLSIVDLGVVRSVKVEDDQRLSITITPTYSGCPAMHVIEQDIKALLLNKGFKEVDVIQSLSPAWTTDWITEKGLQNLEAYGIAPPEKTSPDKSTLFGEQKRSIKCPHCKSMDTRMVSQFGSTACKALYQCNDCLEPFDYFKCI